MNVNRADKPLAAIVWDVVFLEEVYKSSCHCFLVGGKVSSAVNGILPVDKRADVGSASVVMGKDHLNIISLQMNGFI